MTDGDGTMNGLCVTDCTRCPALVASRSRIVNGVGPADAPLMLVGEAPGEQEDAQGEPFVGRSGQLLNEALRTAGIAREAVRITNCVRCRPPDNRDPRAAERSACAGWLEQEIARVDPDVILPVGKIPASHLLDRDVAVTREAGSVEQRTLGGRARDLVICVHPAAVLYDRSNGARLEAAIDTAVHLAGIDPADVPQRRLGDF